MAVHNVRDLLIDRVGVPLSSRFNAVLVATTLPATLVLRSSPTRVGWTIVNNGSFVVFALPGPTQLSAVGFRIEPNGGALHAWWEEDGELVAREWLAMAVGGSSTVRIFELHIEAKAPRSTREEG